jgi:O-acetyl-ADP-ribose deacetylase (regulator of RNase III)
MKTNHQSFFQERIRVIQDDITQAEVDVIVNAANQWLIPGGGVDGAIHRAAGPDLAKATKVFGGLKTSQVVITPGFHLKAKYVMHTLGPIWDNNETEEKLSQDLVNTYQNIFQTAHEKKFRTIAIPNISTGVYGFPKELAAELVVKTTHAFLRSRPGIHHLCFYCFDNTNYQLYTKFFLSRTT